MKKKECHVCGGSGQTGTFYGVSRFLLTWEECPECGGLGYLEDATAGCDGKSECLNTTGEREGTGLSQDDTAIPSICTGCGQACTPEDAGMSTCPACGCKLRYF